MIMRNNLFNVGDRVRRIEHDHFNCIVGKEYTVIDVMANGSLVLQNENGSYDEKYFIKINKCHFSEDLFTI